MPSPAPDAELSQAHARSRSRSSGRIEKDSKDSHARLRSRSPRRSPPRKSKNFSGLKWKKHDRERDEPRDDKDRFRDDLRGYGGNRSRDERDRGYGRDRRDDDRQRDRDRGYGRDRRDDDRPRDRDRDRDRPRRDRDRDSDRRREDRDGRPREDRPPKEKKPAAPVISSGEPMIIVTVNDRLGTKAQIPCMASDTVAVFKKMVSSVIGRPVHEIMLKRQGQRPFHDQLTLADYEVSNGVQLDLELNTGD